jgi:hypothetical protein
METLRQLDKRTNPDYAKTFFIETDAGTTTRRISIESETDRGWPFTVVVNDTVTVSLDSPRHNLFSHIMRDEWRYVFRTFREAYLAAKEEEKYCLNQGMVVSSGTGSGEYAGAISPR